jgi:2-amino-4-hydroxy-6-hydroxymethyldihydropteridine diphosphokinase
MGRKRRERWGPRIIDLDLVAAGFAILPDLETYRQWRDLGENEQMRLAPDRMIVPHPRLQDRAFVLLPLLDVAPNWQHPVLGKTVRQMCDELSPEAVAACEVIGDEQMPVKRGRHRPGKAL